MAVAGARLARAQARPALPTRPVGAKPAASGGSSPKNPAPKRWEPDDAPEPAIPPGTSFLKRTWIHIHAFFAKIVTWLKQPLMPTLDAHRTVVGYAITVKNTPNKDGDIDLDVSPLPADRDVLTYKGQYRPAPMDLIHSEEVPLSPRAAALGQAGAIHCEVKDNVRARLMPEITQLRKLEAQGKTPLIEIEGKWTFDPFHQGWVEIHPVQQIRILKNDYDPNLPAAGG